MEHDGESSRQSPLAVVGNERLLTVGDVAELLCVSAAWVRDHSTRRNPRLPVIRMGSLLRYRRRDIEQFVDRLRQEALRRAG
jgi:hypothetical protein